MKPFQAFLTIAIIAVQVVYTTASYFDLAAAAYDVEQPGFFSFVLQKEEALEGEGEGDDRRVHRLLRQVLSKDEATYKVAHLKVAVVLLNESCSSKSTKIKREEINAFFDANTTVFEVIDAFETALNVSALSGTLLRDLHVLESSYVSLFFFNVVERSCLVIYSKHILKEGFFRSSSGDFVTATFSEPAAEAFGNYSVGVWLTSLGATLIVSLVSLIGVVFVACGLSREGSLFENISDELMAYACGVLLAVVFINLLPEANELYGGVDLTFGVVVLASTTLAFIVKMVLGHDHGSPLTKILEENEESKDEDTDSSLVKGSASINIIWGDAFHNFTDGILIGTAFGACSNNPVLGWLVTFSVILHEIPQELADFMIIYNDYGSVHMALAFNLLSAVAAILGVIVVLSIGKLSDQDFGLLLALSIGALLFICLAEIAPRLVRYEANSSAVARVVLVISGFVTIGLLQLSPELHCEK